MRCFEVEECSLVVSIVCCICVSILFTVWLIAQVVKPFRTTTTTTTFSESEKRRGGGGVCKLIDLRE